MKLEESRFVARPCFFIRKGFEIVTCSKDRAALVERRPGTNATQNREFWNRRGTDETN